MQIEDLWALHEKLSTVLAAKLNEAKDELDKRLVQLNTGIGSQKSACPKIQYSARKTVG